MPDMADGLKGREIVASDGAVGVCQTDENEHGNVLVHWSDGFRGWSQASLVRARLAEGVADVGGVGVAALAGEGRSDD